jgi:2-dehydro-3-deoxyphosphogluconate aldolase/(4S)-4-hydroxy-2-oxoglutarate aldolase
LKNHGLERGEKIMGETEILKFFEENKFVAVIRTSSHEDAETMLQAVTAGGIKILEITTTIPQSMKLIENWSKKEGLLVGAGTVIDGELAQRAINAGAKFISSHYTDREIASVAKNSETFLIQGGVTPTEAVNAWQLGADFVKVYPAEFFGGPQYIKALKGPLPFIKFVAAGEITAENASRSTSDLLRRFDQFNPATFPTAAGVDLGLDGKGEAGAGKFRGSAKGLVRVFCHTEGMNRNAVAGEDLFGLVFVDIQLFSLFNRKVMLTRRPDIVRGRTNEPVVRLLFHHVGRPSRHAACRKNGGEEIDRKPEDVKNGGREKIHIAGNLFFIPHDLFNAV